MITATYAITGMTCEHCVKAVSGAIGDLPGVTDVKVDLAAGEATVTSDAPLDPAGVAGALDDAGGYELVSGGGATG